MRQRPTLSSMIGDYRLAGDAGSDSVTHPSDTCRQLLVCVLSVLVLVMLAGPLHAQPQVLLLFDEDKDLPGLAVINRNIQQVLRTEFDERVEFYSESLNISQFQRPDHQTILRDYFQRKYQDRQIDLIVAVMEPSLDFLLRHADVLFSGVPIVFCGASPGDVEGLSLPDNVTGVLIKRNFAPTLDIALRLHSDTRHVFVIGGNSRFDQQLQSIARRDLQAFESRVNISWLNTLPMEQLLRELSALPENSVIYYLTLFVDGAGEAFIPHEALSRIAEVANAPIYVANDQYVGRGAVGGHVYSVESLGQEAAAIGIRVLRGEQPSNIPVTTASAHKNRFDWRQLDHWRIDERRLPAKSQVDHRRVSIWYLYKWYIVAGCTLFVLQSALVVGLLISRAQRRRAEALRLESEQQRLRAEDEVRTQRDELAHALRLTTLGEMTASFAHELGQPLTAITMNALAAQQILSREGSRSDIDEIVTDVIADATRASQTLSRLRTLFRKEEASCTPVDVNAAVADVLHLLEGEMRQRRIGVQFVRADTSPHIRGDAVQLRQVLINLLINAAEAISSCGDTLREIQIESREHSAGRVEILVRDSGVGVAESELKRIFEHFVSSKPQGLGMGLAISRSIVESYGGLIWATRNEGGGLTMHMDFPSRK